MTSFIYPANGKLNLGLENLVYGKQFFIYINHSHSVRKGLKKRDIKSYFLPEIFQ